MREKLVMKTAEYAAILKPGGEIVYLGTPQSEQSIYRGLPEKGYVVRVWPARYPLADKLGNYTNHLAPMLVEDLRNNPELQKATASALGGAPTDPARFNDLDLLERENEYRASGFLLQYQLDTSLSDAEKYPLKTSDLIVTDLDTKIAPARLVWGSGPDQVIKGIENVGFDGDRLHRPLFTSPAYLEYTGSVMHIDPSGRGRDRTTYCVTKFLAGFIFVTAWGGMQDGYGPETLTELARIAMEQEVNLISPEDNFGDGMFGKLLETYVNAVRPCRIEGYRAVGQKELRLIGQLEPVLKQHRVVIDTNVIRADLKNPIAHSGLYQLTHLHGARGALKQDDMVDVLAASVGYWAEHLNADAKKLEDERKKKADAAWENQMFQWTVGKSFHPQLRGMAARRGRGRPSRSNR